MLVTLMGDGRKNLVERGDAFFITCLRPHCPFFGHVVVVGICHVNYIV